MAARCLASVRLPTRKRKALQLQVVALVAAEVLVVLLDPGHVLGRGSLDFGLRRVALADVDQGGRLVRADRPAGTDPGKEPHDRDSLGCGVARSTLKTRDSPMFTPGGRGLA